MEERMDYLDRATAGWLQLIPGQDLSAYGTVFRIVRAGRIAESALNEIAKKNGLGVRGDYDVLASLRRAHPKPLHPQDLADRVMTSAPGITGRLDRLEASGMISRKPHPTDRRATRVTITAKGRKVADRVFAAIVEAADSMVEDLPASVRADLNGSLRELLIALGDTPRQPPS